MNRAGDDAEQKGDVGVLPSSAGIPPACGGKERR